MAFADVSRVLDSPCALNAIVAAQEKGQAPSLQQRKLRPRGKRVARVTSEGGWKRLHSAPHDTRALEGTQEVQGPQVLRPQEQTWK